MADASQEQGKHVRPSRPPGTHAVTVRMRCARHSRRVVCALQVTISCTRSHQRARTRPDDIRQASGKPGGPQAKIFLCCVDSRVVLGAVSKGRSPSRRLGLRWLPFESQCVSVNRLVVGSDGQASQPTESANSQQAPIPRSAFRLAATPSQTRSFRWR